MYFGCFALFVRLEYWIPRATFCLLSPCLAFYLPHSSPFAPPLSPLQSPHFLQCISTGNWSLSPVLSPAGLPLCTFSHFPEQNQPSSWCTQGADPQLISNLTSFPLNGQLDVFPWVVSNKSLRLNTKAKPLSLGSTIFSLAVSLATVNVITSREKQGHPWFSMVSLWSSF